jgi:hypothetical protein
MLSYSFCCDKVSSLQNWPQFDVLPRSDLDIHQSSLNLSNKISSLAAAFGETVFMANIITNLITT